MTAPNEIRYTLVTDGSSDAVLTYHLSWRRLGDMITDFSPLRSLAAFDRLEREIQAIVRANSW